MIDINTACLTTVRLPFNGPSVLACGAWLKNTVCLTCDDTAYLSPIIGDLDTAEARYQFNETVGQMCHGLNIKPEIVVHDLHPDFYSTEFACHFAAEHQLPVLAIQHHHAHIAAICAEHQITEPVLGLALDGVGLGTDHQPWGGELLLVDGAHFQRLGHLAPLALPGGDRAAQEPWRMAAAALAKLNRADEVAQRFSEQSAVHSVITMLEKNLHCPQTSSMGRLFDSAAGLLGVSVVQSFEAQAAINLQQLAEENGPVAALPKGYRITNDNQLDFLPLLSVLADESNRLQDVATAAALFHATVSAGLAEWVRLAAKQHGITWLALGGGCFHNRLLLQGLKDRLESDGPTLLIAQKLLPDDSAIALGQAWVAIQA